MTSPVLVYVSGYGQPTYRYEAVEIEADGNAFDYDDDRVRFFQGFEGVDCYLEIERSRVCALERQLLDGNQTIDDQRVDYPTVDELYTYHDGQFYERRDTFRNGTLVLGLRAVSAGAVLSTVSYDLEGLARPLQRAVEGGTGIAHRDLDAHGRVVWHEGSYYAIYEAESSQAKGYPASFVGAIAGLWLLSRSVQVEIRE